MQHQVGIFSDTELAVLALISVLAAVANFKTAKHIWSAFSMKRTVFLLECVDATIEALLGVAFVVATVWLHLCPGNLGSCTFAYTILFLFRFCGQLITVEVASIR